MNQVNNEVNVIFFDAGGVLFDTFVRGDERVTNLLMERGYPKNKIEDAIHKAKQTELSFVTNWNEEEDYFKRYYGTIAKELGESDLTYELLYFAHYARNCELFPEVKDVLDVLSKKYRLAVISNAMPSMDWVFDRLGIRKYFETFILSAIVQAEKPAPAIYTIALKQLDARKEESIFIDDKLENIEGSESVGIRGLHLDRNRVNLIELLKEEKLW